MFEEALNSDPRPSLFTWRGQRVRVATEPTQGGKRLRFEFMDSPAHSESKEKIQIAYREIEEEKARLEDFQKFYVREVLATSCGGKRIPQRLSTPKFPVEDIESSTLCCLRSPPSDRFGATPEESSCDSVRQHSRISDSVGRIQRRKPSLDNSQRESQSHRTLRRT